MTNNTPAPATPPTGSALISNIGQTNNGNVAFTSADSAQGFTTGAGGYALRSVGVVAIAALGSDVRVRVTSGTPGGSTIATLTNPSSLAAGTLTFSAPTATTLAASTTYYVVLDNTFSGSIGYTNSTSEDSGGASGWSIEDSRQEKTTTSWSTASGALRIRVNGDNPPPPKIDLVRIVSAPTYDADSDGVRDTFVQGDKILADVEYSEPVSVTGTPRLRLQLGTDGSGPVTGNRKRMDMESELHGGRTLRFAYTVAAADTDTDGVWVETAGTNKTVVFLPGGATIKSANSGFAAGVTWSGLPTTGDANAKVDGAKTSADTGPRPTVATVNGATLEVTFDTALDTSVDTSKLPLYFSVYGTELSGGHRNAYQHPATVAFAAGDTTNTKLVLTLGDPARAGDTVTLNYTLINHTGLLKDADDKEAPAFFDLAVTNNTLGTAGPAPSRASVWARTLQLVFDGDLDEASTPAGSAFLVETSDPDGDRRSIAGTGTATVSGATVTVELDEDEEPVGANDLVRVSYTVPTSNPLQNADGDDVLAFERFRVEEVLDGIAPEFVGGEAMQTSTSPATSKVVIYFDEPLDSSSVPVAGHFTLLMGPPSTSVTPSSVAVEGDAVTLTLNQGIASTITTVSLGYITGSNSIVDLAGNAAAGFTHGMTPTTAATPMLATSGAGAPAVDGASLTLTYDLPLDPAKVPGADRYTLHYQLATGETEADRDEYPRKTAAVAVRSKKIVLRLDAPVYPCDPEPTVSYAQTTGGPNVQGIDGQAAADIEHQVVDNKREATCTTSQGVSGNSGGQGKSVALKFGRTLDTDRTLQASAFRLAGASAPSVTGAAYTADAAGVALTLDRALAPGETVEARYERPVGEPGLWDTAGEQIENFSGVTVTNEEPAAPAVTRVELVSDAGEDDTYGLGDAIRIRLTFSEPVDVTGSPRLKIDMDPEHWGEKWVAYESGDGTDSLTFSHTVVEPNESTQGIAVLANTLQANGGAIRSASAGTDAALGHDGLNHDPAHKVDWRLAPTGTASVTGVEVVSDSGSDDTYALGETIRVRVTFSEAVSATGAPRLRIDMDPAPHWGAKWAVYEGGDGTESLSFAYEVVEPNESTQGIAVLADTLEANGGAIRSVSGGADAHLSHTGLGHDPAHKGDWRLGPGGKAPAPGAAAGAAAARARPGAQGRLAAGAGGERPGHGRAGDRRDGAGGRDADGVDGGHRGRGRAERRDVRVSVGIDRWRHGGRHRRRDEYQLHARGLGRGQGGQGAGDVHRRRRHRGDADQRRVGDGGGAVQRRCDRRAGDHRRCAGG